MMGAPFYVPFAVSEYGLSTAYVGVFVAILQFSSILSNLLWAYLGHRFGNRSLLIGGSYFMAASIAVPLLSSLIPETPMGWSLVPGEELTARIAFFSLTFVMSGFAMSGVFTGRMTYVLDIAPPGRRPTYTSFLNMSMLPQGFLPMLAGGLASWISYKRMFAVALLTTPVATWLSHRLEDVDR
jgi:MFS family permease